MAESLWKQRLRKASWRGIEFFIDDHSFETGLNTVNHEFPDREKPFVEDLGRKSRSFSVNGHILGDDYFSLRDQLIAACEQPGAGELIHPYLGSRIVKCSNFSVREDTKNGRIAQITFSFVEAGDIEFPRAAEDKRDVLEDLSEEADQSAIDEFTEDFSITGLPGEMVQAARDQVAEAAEKFDESTQFIQTAADDIANLAFDLRNLQAEIDDLLNAPEELGNRLKNSIGLLADSGFTARDGFQAASFLFDFGSSSTFQKVDIDTPSRNQQNQNTDAIKNLVRRLAVTQSVQKSIDTEFRSVDEALEERERVNSVIDEQIEATQSDKFYQDFRDISATFTDAVPDQDADLPNIVELDLKVTKPAIVIAYDLFQSPEAESDLISRNNVRHPGFVEGDQTIEVLGDG